MSSEFKSETMEIFNRNTVKFVFMFTVIMIGLGFFTKYISRTLPGDYIDENTLKIIRVFLERADRCDDIVKENIISSRELKQLRQLEKHYIFTYTNIKEIEQRLSCEADDFSRVLYTGWSINKTNKQFNEKTNLENIIIGLTQASIPLSVDNSKHIPAEVLEVLGKIEFFKKPFKLERALLDEASEGK